MEVATVDEMQGQDEALHAKVDRLEDKIDGIKRDMDKQMGRKVDEDDGDENKERGNWGTKLSFILSCIGYAVGLGNIWRFPYLCYKNGGGAFLIPYLVSLVCLGIPIFALEIFLGQFPSQGALTCWGLCPLFTGVGWCGVLVSSFINIYYNMIMAWAIFYFFASFSFTLPWDTCKAPWAGTYCKTLMDPDVGSCNATGNLANDNGTCTNNINGTVIGIYNRTAFSEYNLTETLPGSDYFVNRVLRRTDGFEDMGPVYADLFFCLLAAWVLTYLCLIKGIKTSGMVVYFTALFPYVVMIAFFIQGIMLPGAEAGVSFFTTPNMSLIADAGVWSDAASQIFYSLSAAMGGLHALGSYNKFNYNFIRDSFIVSIVNSATSLFAGVIVFSYIGFIAHELNQDVDSVVDSGPGLVFEVYPTALAQLPGAPIWSIIFFGMVISLAIDSQFVGIEAVSTGIEDLFPSKLRGKKWLTNLIICIVSFVLGISLTSGGGIYMLTLLDYYSGYWNMFMIVVCECICVMYFYGFRRLREDIRAMVGDNPCCPWSVISWGFAIMWGAITPAGCLFILIYSWVSFERSEVAGYLFPWWAEILGILLDVGIILSIFIVPLILVCTKKYTFRELFRPTPEYGPMLPKHRKLINHVPGFEVDPHGTEDMAEGKNGAGNKYELTSRI